MGKRALVTGASSGIGREFARILARGGFDLFIAARDKKGLAAVATELHDRYGTTVEVLAIDLSKPNSGEKLYNAATENGRIEVLINNAGFGDLHYFKDAEWEKLHAMINLNILTLTYLSRLAAKDMANYGSGKILNVASTAAYTPGPQMAVYHASKAYVLSFSVALAEELRSSGVTVTSLSPGFVRTGFQEAAEMQDRNVVKNRNRMPTPYEVALFGYEAMMDGRTSAIPGFRNKFYAGFTSVLPKKTTARMLDTIYKRGV